MNSQLQQQSGADLSPKRLKEKADSLETNIYKTVSRQDDPSMMHVKISRKNFFDTVIQKALIQLMPRFNIPPRFFLMGLRELMQKPLRPGESAAFEKELVDPNDESATFSDEIGIRTFEARATSEVIEIFVRGVPPIPSADGGIAKSFFNHEKSPGQLLKDGIINFKEINKYPIVNGGEDLFYITYEKQGAFGLSYTGQVITVRSAVPYPINIGPGIERIEDQSGEGPPKGYFLKAAKTGVVLLERDANDQVTSIDITDMVEVKKLDYSTGNVGTTFTCPVSMKVGVVCNGFKMKVHGQVEVTVLDGGEIITNNRAEIMKSQAGSSVTALKDISVNSATRTTIVSEEGPVVITRELIDSEVAAPTVIFDLPKGLLTNNTIEAENLKLNGLYYSGVTTIHFGRRLFLERQARLKSAKHLQVERQEIDNRKKLLLGKLQMELKRLTHMASNDPELIKSVKPLIIATRQMNFDIINDLMDTIRKRNNTKVVTSVGKVFEELEKLPAEMKINVVKSKELNDEIKGLTQRMASMSLTIEGFLRRAASIRVFCGLPPEEGASRPDFLLESEDAQNKMIRITASYTQQNGFEFVH